jgi:hypothetical protein
MPLDFKTMDISFCGKNALNVVEKDDKIIICDNIMKDKYDITSKYKFASIINDKSIKFLSLNPHLITIKSNGSNYFLLMTSINNTNCCFFIDRKTKNGYTYPRIVSVKYRFDDDIFKDTLLEGEIIRDENDNWMFLVNDLLLFKGKKVVGNIVNKYNRVYDILENMYTPDNEMDVCPIRVKKIFKYSEYVKLITQFIPSIKYKIRGMYFVSLNEKHSNHLYLYSTNQQEQGSTAPIKNKPKDKSSAGGGISKGNYIFNIKETDTPDIYELYVNGDDGLVKHSIAYVGKISTSKRLKKYFQEAGDEMVNIECKYNDKFKKWEPLERIDTDNIVSLNLLS